VNRAEKAREYLSNRLRDFDGFRNLEDSKISFFYSVVAFRESITTELRRFRIFEEHEIIELDKTLAEIDKCRNKRGMNYKVYHSTWIYYGNAKKKIVDLMKTTSTIKLPFKYKIIDICTSRAFIITMLAVILAFIGQIIIILCF
jgi:hypothetical protein